MRACRVLALTLVICSPAAARAAAQIPQQSAATHDIRPGPGVTATKMLATYAPSLANTPGDTKIYVLEGREPGSTVLAVGGTHANEIAGIMAAVLLVERAQVKRGRLIVVPHANNSAITDVDPERPGPEFITLRTASGDRQFRYGSRRTNIVHQGKPDPSKYRHPRSSEDTDGVEARNLNRVYPGVADGTLTERIAYGIMQVITAEKVALAFDFHETGPESRLTWMLVASPKNIDMAAMAVLDIEAHGITPKLEPSSDSAHGMSHREWGDLTPAKAFLFETPSPSMISAAAGVDFVNDATLPLSKRVGGHLLAFSSVLGAYNAEAKPADLFTVLNVPSLPEVVKSGVGAFLK